MSVVCDLRTLRELIVRAMTCKSTTLGFNIRLLIAGMITRILCPFCVPMICVWFSRESSNNGGFGEKRTKNCKRHSR